MKRALISVYDKTNIVDFCKKLVDIGWELVSTGGSKKLLEDSGLKVLGVDELTKSPEILGGRVKTLHPSIHGGILFKRDDNDHVETIKTMGIEPVDMVVNSLYPFEETVKKQGSSQEEIIENIDIGGPSMIRAAAKNFKDVIIITDHNDYGRVLEELEEGDLSFESRKKLAAKAFRQTAFYDSMIAGYFTKDLGEDFPDLLTKGYRFKEELRYGENPHQKAAYYESPLDEDFGFTKLHGKAVSYNNYNDATRTINLVREFDESVCVAVKHTNPCGVGLGQGPAQAFQRAYDCDPISIFGGIIGFNREVDKEAAEKLSKIFLEIIIAPSFTEEALEILTQKENIRLIESKNIGSFKGRPMTLRETVGGVLVQEEDLSLYYEESLSLVAGEEVSGEVKEDLDFAWKVVKHCSSNAIVIAKDGMTLGLGLGQVRRVWALENALERSEFDLEGAVAASDGFFFDDTIELLNKYGIKSVVQPGGSVQDEKVIEKAKDYGIAVYFTGMRHFKH